MGVTDHPYEVLRLHVRLVTTGKAYHLEVRRAPRDAEHLRHEQRDAKIEVRRKPEAGGSAWHIAMIAGRLAIFWQ